MKIDSYTYALPEDRIAKYPQPIRHDSKLLVYKDEKTEDRAFKEIPELFPENSFVIFNHSKVVPARFIFQKETGALIEIFCLTPATPPEYNRAFLEEESTVWYCEVGNVKKWKSGPLHLHNPQKDRVIREMQLQAFLLGKEAGQFLVKFVWLNGYPFSAVMETAGKMPIPPYLKRKAEPSDTDRYQTIYACERGSVAAPTAGLHFSDQVMEVMKNKGIKTGFLNLHVGAGTFRPVKEVEVKRHTMHSEPFSVTLSLLRQLISHSGPFVPVGTTTCRCLESLYYLGCRVASGKEPLFVGQWEPYRTKVKIPYRESLEHLLSYLEKNGEKHCNATTQMIIAPGFLFRATDVLITNFHQPNSTLLLLVAALAGDGWKEIYEHALQENYRFLSYGDSCMIFNHS